MAKKYSFVLLILFLSLSLLATACEEEATTPELESILVIPTSTSLETGGIQQYMAIGAYADGSTGDITGFVTWTSSSAAVAIIDTGGQVTAVAVGTTTVRARLNDVRGEATLTVTEPPEVTLEAISVTPESAGKEAGESQQYSATGTYSDGSSKDITAEVGWESSDTNVATISSTGLATAVSAGNAVISATLDTVSGEALFIVTEPGEIILVSISVTPASIEKQTDESQQFAATGTYSDDSTANVTEQVNWESSDTAIATISSTGLATAVEPGTVTITATLDDVSGTATLTVTGPSGGPPPRPPGHFSTGCTTCHKVGGPGVGVPGGTGLPPDHEGRTDDMCLLCHA